MSNIEVANNNVSFLEDPAISTETKKFLTALNSGGVPLETLSPEGARLVLVNAQQSVDVDYSGIEESEKTILQDGFSIKW